MKKKIYDPPLKTYYLQKNSINFTAQLAGQLTVLYIAAPNMATLLKGSPAILWWAVAAMVTSHTVSTVRHLMQHRAEYKSHKPPRPSPHDAHCALLYWGSPAYRWRSRISEASRSFLLGPLNIPLNAFREVWGAAKSVLDVANYTSRIAAHYAKKAKVFLTTPADRRIPASFRTPVPLWMRARSTLKL